MWDMYSIFYFKHTFMLTEINIEEYTPHFIESFIFEQDLCPFFVQLLCVTFFVETCPRMFCCIK